MFLRRAGVRRHEAVLDRSLEGRTSFDLFMSAIDPLVVSTERPLACGMSKGLRVN